MLVGDGDGVGWDKGFGRDVEEDLIVRLFGAAQDKEVLNRQSGRYELCGLRCGACAHPSRVFCAGQRRKALIDPLISWYHDQSNATRHFRKSSSNDLKSGLATKRVPLISAGGLLLDSPDDITTTPIHPHDNRRRQYRQDGPSPRPLLPILQEQGEHTFLDHGE